eukprot:CAMPEP_0168214394 /NCGR_PEP_ID=MMETSP0140_2-20121125/5324_1 /TAXON_ID=44445 /ORGANISM="Pseudo-nitzschia australis, Strain 10249 10 AB" /LENGTH=367 /DNA_ID=CAMNT_0008141347 /DNA_START=146 /DNA_END=1249 /DNA_ORIENTATION=-
MHSDSNSDGNVNGNFNSENDCSATPESSSTSLSPASLLIGSKDFVFWYDILLGCSGVVITLTAARDFPHRQVKNIPGQSGTLHRKAIVTHSEMIEHSFYQGLNLLQSLYLHTLYRYRFVGGVGSGGNSYDDNDDHNHYKPIRILCLWVVTAPWLLRHKFPVHSFSQNWRSESKSKQQISSTGIAAETKSSRTMNKTKNNDNDKNNGRDDDGEEVVLYRIKKAQYVFYKHVILHGLNISVALASSNVTNYDRHQQHRVVPKFVVIPYGIEWRVFWLLLNTSYVMEFFLQTLVKRSLLSQSHMISLQRLLMAAASLAAVNVLLLPEKNTLRVGICFLSFAMNFVHRHHDVANTMCIAVGFLFWDSFVVG